MPGAEKTQQTETVGDTTVTRTVITNGNVTNTQISVTSPDSEYSIHSNFGQNDSGDFHFNEHQNGREQNTTYHTNYASHFGDDSGAILSQHLLVKSPGSTIGQHMTSNDNGSNAIYFTDTPTTNPEVVHVNTHQPADLLLELQSTPLL